MVLETRLVIAGHPARRDRLHGSWWPRSTELEVELAPMLSLAATKFRSVIRVVLNLGEWPNAGASWQPVTTSAALVDWSMILEPRLAILDCGNFRHVALLVLPPDTPERVALTATFMACAAGNSLSALQTLAVAHQQVGPVC